MDRYSMWIYLFLYVVSTVAFLFLAFLFFDLQGLSWINFGIAMVIFVPAVIAVGYLLISDILSSKNKQDKRLQNITAEVLHEINLPISTIETNLQMIQKGLNDPKDAKRAERITGATDRLKRLYHTLMYSIKKEIGSVEVESFDLSELIRERVSLFEDMSRNRFNIDLNPCIVVLDRIGMEQVIDNILENSMKYSNPDQPIEIYLDKKGRLRIVDHGKGMDGVQIARIYERYYQGDSHSPGEGIGLALVKRYCDEFKIGIKIDSEPDRGTEVIFDLSEVMKK